MDSLRNAIEQGNVLLDIQAENLSDVFHQAMGFLAAKKVLPHDALETIEDQLRQREETAPTAIGHSVSVPHVYLPEIPEQTVLWVRLRRPLNLGAPDGIPTRFFVFLLGPQEGAAQHLDTLSQVARLMSDEEFRYDAAGVRSHAQLLPVFDAFLARCALPHIAVVDRGIPEELRYSGRLFGGIVGDLRRRLPKYASDLSDGLHRKSISSTLFLYFACIAPAVIFGGVLDEETGHQIGVIEIVLASAVCGMIYAVLSGTPLIILGGTGPLLIFTVIVYDLCTQFDGRDLPFLGAQADLPFLETRAVIGLLAGVALLILAVTDASCLMRFFTRFTDEIFAVLISIIFIQEAIKLLLHIFERTHLPSASPEFVSVAAALFSLLLALGTFYVAMMLSRIRRTRYLLKSVREFLADFGPAIALLVMTLLAMYFLELYPTELVLDRLTVKSSFSPSVERNWLLDVFAVDWKVWLVCMVPALLLAVLVYADQNITARLVNSPDHNLQKGGSYHWDLALMGVLIAVCSVFGWPWLVAATVRSLNHVRSLATTEEVVAERGTTRERVVHVRENRITPFAIHLLIGLSILLLPVLNVIPMAVLYGLFFFMGVISLSGNQFFERTSMWFMDTKLYPSTHFTRRVPHRVMHIFTAIQVACLISLIVVKNSVVAILFPLLLICFIPVRIFAGRFFAPEHLEALDSDETPDEEEMRSAD